MRFFYPILLIFLFGCGEANVVDPETEKSDEDICYDAAIHRETCTGEFITPPECTPSVLVQSQELLDTPCDEMEETFEQSGKADGAFCDWFGSGCNPDEPIFAGKSCTTSSECGGKACLEGHCFDGITSPEFRETLDLFTTSTLDIGSKTELLVDAEETRLRRMEMIRNAKEFIHFSAFIIEDDAAGKEMVDLFVEAVERGVEARVIVDATTQWTFSDYGLLRTMANSGVEVLVFNPIIEWESVRPGTLMTINDRFHEKLLVADGNKTIIGGRNIGDNYLLANKWRDTDVFIEGPGVKGVHQVFLTDWQRISEFEVKAGCPNKRKYGFACPTEDLNFNPKYQPELPQMGSAATRSILSNPHTQDTPEGYFTTLALVRAAQKSITISNSYFVPPRRLRHHLKEAVKRGVKVKVLTNSKTSTDAVWMYYASINYYRELISAGIEIYQYKGTETMHSKTMLVDDEVAVVGSFNLDPRSCVDNSEAMVLIHNGNAVRELDSAMDVDFNFATKATADFSRVEILKARSFRLVEPLL